MGKTPAVIRLLASTHDPLVKGSVREARANRGIGGSPGKLVVITLALAFTNLAAADDIVIRMLAGSSYGIPPKESPSTTAQVRRSVFEEFHRQNPGVRVVNAGGLSFNGSNLDDSMFLMSMAGDSSPDIFYVNFRQYYTFLEQGFCRPLDDLIAQDPSVMERCNPTVKKVLTSYDGKVYAVPFFQVATALYYRRDLFREVGLNPDKPPKNWDELLADAKKLADPKQGRYGFALSSPPGYQWSNFLYAAGGESVQQDKDGNWKSAIHTPEAGKAIDFFRQLMSGANPPGTISRDLTDDIRRGKIAMWLNYTNDVLLQQSDLPPSVIGIARVPAGPAGFSNEVNAGMWAISSRVTDPAKLRACWKFIKFFSGDAAAKVNTDKCIELGLGNLVNPSWLKKFGYTDLLSQVDPAYVQANDELFQTGHPEPYGKNCQQVYSVLDNALDRARLNPKEPAEQILKAAEAEMNDKLLGYTPPEVMAKRRGFAVGVLVLFCISTLAIVLYFLRKARQNATEFLERIPAGTDRRRMRRFMAFCLTPAVASIAIWSYYPLLRGLVIAFQDYGIQRGARWVGLDNFIGVFTQPLFYQSLWNSVVYVALTILVGFFMPILLALALNEIPRFKVLFRTIFYLPAMTSSIVIAFVWRQFYDKSPAGLLNTVTAPVIEHVFNPLFKLVGHAPWPLAHDWLGDPSLAIFAVVLPGVWAGAGPGSILYLAALKNISEDRYEAADLDGANWVQKIRYITLPGLKPLILINLLGVFIAGFKAMENIFVLTQGGPLNSTRTIGLEIWQNAFMYLKFGYATAAAWVMGSILIGFTLIQIRSLLRMRFSTAKV